MTREELQQLIADVQKYQSELANVEVKAARGGTPRRLYEPLSAFANRTGGGVLLFGLNEGSNFSIAGVGNAQRLQEDITHLASSDMEPALRPHFLVDEIDGETVVAVEIDELPAVLIDGVFRREIPEYPQEALREALANAVAHRDYSPYVRGSYIQVRMFADRLELQSPGGLFGNVTVENLEDEHSTRNARLMRMMEDMHVVENRGSGISAMLQAMREANLEPPRFDDRRTSFLVSLRNYTLLNPEAIAWLNQFAHVPLNDRQRLALVYLRQHEYITNGDYRRLNRIDAMVAGQELRGLVQTGLIEPHGASRWTSYTLRVLHELPAQQALHTDEEKSLAHVRMHGTINNSECRELLSVEDKRAWYLLRKLRNAGALKRQGEGRWSRYTLP